MLDGLKPSQWLPPLLERISENEVFKQLKAKWDELDPQSRLYARSAMGVLGTLTVLTLVLSTLGKTSRLEHEVAEKTELISMLNSATDEIKILGATPSTTKPSDEAGGAEGKEPDWNATIQAFGEPSRIPKEKITLSSPLTPQSSDSVKESLIDVSLSQINVRQLLTFLVQAESSEHAIRVRNMQVDTIGTDGHLQAKIALSAFHIKK